MYAVFKSGGKQYRVSEGQIVRIEKLNNAAGETVAFDQIMMIVNNDNIQIGSPLVNGSKIIAQVLDHNRGDKVMIIKFRRRKHFRKHQGHRQWFTNIKIMSIHSSSESI